MTEFDEFLVYAKTRGPDEFSYFSKSNCAFAQFLKDTEKCKRPSVGSTSWIDTSTGIETPICVDINWPLAMMGGDNFSDLVQRLEDVKAEKAAKAVEDEMNDFIEK